MIYLAADLGFGGVKLYDGKTKHVEPSQVARAVDDIYSDEISNMDPSIKIVKVGPSTFYVGGKCYNYGVVTSKYDYRKLLGSEEIRAALYAALSNFVTSGDTVKIAVGLPSDMLYANNNMADAMKSWINGQHNFSVNGKNIQVYFSNTMVTSQAAAAYSSLYYTDQGLRSQFTDSMCAVASIGFNTVELSVFEGSTMIPRYTKSLPVGVRRLFEIARSTNYPVGEWELKHRLGIGVYNQRDLQVYFDEVNGAIETVWGQHRVYSKMFGKVKYCGGGAILLANLLNNEVVMDDPEFAVARGLYNMIQVKRGNSKSSTK